jgi:Protein of unknown function (DUF3053)
MIVFSRRVAGFAALFVVVAGLAATLAGCGDSEADQRKAFIGFLQTRILDKSGLHVPVPTPAETSSFGPYASHYTVMTDFLNNPVMLGIGESIGRVTKATALNSFQDLADHRDEYRAVAGGLRKLREAINTEVAKAEAAKAALKQPDDLRAIYDKVYEKLVTAPVRGFNEVLPLVDDIATATLKLADYLDANRARITMSGRTVTGKDAQTVRDLNGFLRDLNSYAPKFQDAQRRLGAILGN